MAYYGNLALRPERADEQQVKPGGRGAAAPAKAARRRAIPIGEKLLYLLTIGLVVLIAGFIIFRYAQIYQINSQLQSTNKAYNQETEQTKELQKEVERLSDPNRIKDIAKSNGYVPLSGDRIVASKDVQPPVALGP
ncbi:cell division protein FtsL [Paenibacillaceae bacterium WGS1546]|uniref:cell division protein FtsL n=1 Tax=Cohnella sp. WGS1546 TaxID=3366810 RepID=UPI00372CFD2C